eukprot:CAMPEP_0174310146 /NCGR_PEP_ID=MMETSP0810-20121108/2862_1 /TAXON_ID=73025 ORGANISM="Eutreptiella gymnastica-like, Strain CCMP1594" /NCGR_SAMPLE_ID=MMETSP0810 /ASSEMBLY_ACC=CAM_ASM_000659 /LENGTH=56 /DNA_ID=CAMNT_0015417975 /DNA_START=575 /DNA_END=746 /DNA_ORIENTATION=-
MMVIIMATTLVITVVDMMRYVDVMIGEAVISMMRIMLVIMWLGVVATIICRHHYRG